MSKLKEIACPYCGKAMNVGYIFSGKNSIVWTPTHMKASVFNNVIDENEIQLAKLNYFEGCSIKVFRCQVCRKMMIDENDLEK